VLFHTGDLDFARERVAQKFCNHRLDIVGDRHVFDAAHHHAPGQMLSLNYIRYGADVLIDPGELEHFYLIQIPLVGAATIRNGSREVLTDITTASVLNPQWSTRMFWWQGCEQVLVQVRKAPFMAFAERILGRSLHRPIAFEPRIDFARPEMARWRAWVLGLVRALDAGDALPQLTSAAYEQQLMEDFLRHQPHDMSDFIDDVDLSAAPRHLRRAVEFMRENLAEPLTVLDLADAAEVSSRTLQLAWQATYGLTPMQALARERLRCIRYDLRRADDTATVADAALKWGYPHLGRLSAAYRSAFGEYPSDTLRARRG
jgi:AraC-like DNA-binding protein